MIFIAYFLGFQLDTIYLGTALYNGEMIHIYIYTPLYMANIWYVMGFISLAQWINYQYSDVINCFSRNKAVYGGIMGCNGTANQQLPGNGCFWNWWFSLQSWPSLAREMTHHVRFWWPSLKFSINKRSVFYFESYAGGIYHIPYNVRPPSYKLVYKPQ